ncbi:MAG: sensor histidine kinase [Christensenellaceae bacterium]|jgi:two-component system sensor histidine kinase YesM|nr:sensor histidine kinase [Christensenellaceae bacterium]
MPKISKLSTKLTLRFLAIFLSVFVVLGGVIQIVAAVSSNSYVEGNFYSSHRETDAGLASLLDEATFLYAAIVAEDNRAVLSEINNSAVSQIEREAIFVNLINSMPILSEYFANIVLSGETGIFSYKEGFDLPSNSFLSRIADGENELVIGGIHGGVIQLGKALRGISGDVDGVIVFYLNERALNDLAIATKDEAVAYSFIAADDGLVISHTDEKMVGRTFLLNQYLANKPLPFHARISLDGKRRLVVATEASEVKARYGLRIVVISVLDADIVYENSTRAMLILSGFMLPAIIVGILVSVRRGRKISAPINELNNNIHEFIKNPQKGAVAHGGDEIDQLGTSYEEMTVRILDLIEKQREDLETQRKLELDALQIQINPHILYNTLDAIAWMAKKREQADIEKLSIGLARFFRTSLHKGDKFVTVHDEIEIVKTFISIDKIRFPEKFTVSYDIDENILDYSTLKLIVQPIVENAIKHGLSPMERMGELKISAYADGDDLLFEIQDNGVGLDVNELSKKNESLVSGYGLKNVNERIRLEYGEGYGVTIESELGKGTLARVRIKKRY